MLMDLPFFQAHRDYFYLLRYLSNRTIAKRVFFNVHKFSLSTGKMEEAREISSSSFILQIKKHCHRNGVIYQGDLLSTTRTQVFSFLTYFSLTSVLGVLWKLSLCKSINGIYQHYCLHGL